MLFVFLVALLVCIGTDARVPVLNMTRGEVWPLPQDIRYLNGTRLMPGKVSYVFEGVTLDECDILRHLSKKAGKLLGPLQKVRVH